MDNNQMIVQLRKLRQRREDHARGVVAVHQARVSEARQNVEAASQMLTEHLQRAIDEQNAAVSGLANRVVKATEFHMAQSRYEASITKAGQIQAQGEAAVLVQEQREVGLAEAQRRHVQSRKALLKLEKLADQIEKRAAPRHAAAAELLDDEGRLPHASQKQ
ncbi:MAG TPA: hypothetical protein VGV39_12765 [Mesorhizobium sp.]|jgi:hypothetical protein|uniref:hypothetical protein n=1 Tax=Mesorhizobium sp. TaxID=1871066 RepID=UPI002DDD01D3|nr:hypothetical protein [Mesorhizobium sp.]HEV2503943.1 hypothetical protein [Mesorhizobium sp.]